jgi:polar amino acid transport system substrate-binding protein
MWQMKHWPAGRLPIAAIVLFAAVQAQAAAIGVPENLPPWGLSAASPAGERGIYADLADAIVAHTQISLEIRFVPYGRMFQEVKTGELDYAFGVVSPAISAAGPFIAVFTKVPMIAIARKGLSLKQLEDLRGFSEVGYLRGGSCGPLVDGDAAVHRVGQDSYDSAIRKLAAGRLDAWCSIKPGFTYALNNLHMAADMGDEVDYSEVKVGFQVTGAKADSAEAHELASVVEKLVQDGTAGKIVAHYVGVPYPP